MPRIKPRFLRREYESLYCFIETDLTEENWRDLVNRAALLFLPPIALASLAMVAGAPAHRRRTAQAGLALGAVAWIGILSTMGVRGLQALF